jgi:hypothetical protein
MKRSYAEVDAGRSVRPQLKKKITASNHRAYMAWDIRDRCRKSMESKVDHLNINDTHKHD